jgi:hypothetical protein
MPTLTKTGSHETFIIDSRGFLYLKFSSKSNYNVLKIREVDKYLEAISNICKQTSHCLIVDLTDVSGIVSANYSCLRTLAKDIQLNTVCKKIALITNSLPLRLKLDNYITRHKPNVHTRVFQTLDDGIDFCVTSKIK